MAPDQRRIDIGTLLSGAIDVVRERPRPFLLYLAVFIPLAALGGVVRPGLWLAPSLAFNGPVGFAYLVASLAGQFMLFERLLDAPARDWSRWFGRFLGFGLLAFVAFFGVFLAGGMFFVIPGLLLGGRWLASPGMYVMGERDPIQALGASWNATRGYTLWFALTIFVVFLGSLIVASLVSAPLRGVFGLSGDAVLAVNAMAMQLVPLCFVALSVAAYRQLTGQADPGGGRGGTKPGPGTPKPYPRNNLS